MKHLLRFCWERVTIDDSNALLIEIPPSNVLISENVAVNYKRICEIYHKFAIGLIFSYSTPLGGD